MNEPPRRRRLLAIALPLGMQVLAGGCQRNVRLGPDAVAGKTPDGTIEMREVQAAYLVSGSGGEGVLTYRGRRHPFNVGGAGFGGIGASTIDAYGEVYNLRNLTEFPGAYAQARYGIALGTTSAGDLWLQNEAGVIMRLKAKRDGLMLSLGGDAVVISLR
ncbi:hypothetical protein ACFQS7_25470 [Dankookia sp. GCM10030260]|uniref:hypothetical protein n=1 Tax=Dankookia sp. GCM10030260 TaxID=3273390 RepID=UPI0036087BF1